MSDVVMVHLISRSWEDSPRCVSQRRLYDRDFQRRKFLHRDRCSISLKNKIREVVRVEKAQKMRSTHCLDAPVQIVLQVRGDHVGLEGRETRTPHECGVEMYESLGHDVYLVTTVAALRCRTVHECGMDADERGTSAPLRRILWDLAHEDQH
jgi:hypothetical protein